MNKGSELYYFDIHPDIHITISLVIDLYFV